MPMICGSELLILDCRERHSNRNGPLFDKQTFRIGISELQGLRLQYPAVYYSQSSFFSIAWPEVVNKNRISFSKIEDALLKEK